MIKKAALEILTPLLLIAFAGDLIYLCFMGGWREPNSLILISELVAFLLCIVLGIWGVCHFVRTAREDWLKGKVR